MKDLDEIIYPDWETQGGTTPEQNEAHFGEQLPAADPPQSSPLPWRGRLVVTINADVDPIRMLPDLDFSSPRPTRDYTHPDAAQ